MKEIIIEGKYTTAKCFTVDNEANAIDTHARAQIKMICDDEITKDSIIRIMPDVHAGKVGPIGLTIKLGHNRIIPNLLGNDLGCGISVFKLDIRKRKLTDSDFNKLDKLIRDKIPSGSSIRSEGDRYIDKDYDLLFDHLNVPINKLRILRSMYTLGGGNHFIEVGKNDSDEYFLTIHSGSRSLGPVINDYYNRQGQDILKKKGVEVPYEMTYLEDDLFSNYVSDVSVATAFARSSRHGIASIISDGMKWIRESEVSIPHNYFDTTRNTLHKGASGYFEWGELGLKKYETIYIPINMKDGILYGKPVENTDWNCSFPHGSGRLIPRSEIANLATVSSFKKEMKGIFSTSIGKDTLDESPFAYRRIDELKDAVSGVIKLEGVITPVYNFKAGD